MSKISIQKRSKIFKELYILIAIILTFILLAFFIWLWYDIKIHQIDNQASENISLYQREAKYEMVQVNTGFIENIGYMAETGMNYYSKETHTNTQK
ncbi:MAG: hypothetical protein M9887_00615 [Chitinophagales bacterium]|nr:hypothetical protein [Chitinophagales bacterium]